MEVLLRQPSAGCLYPWGLQLQKVDRPDSGTCLVVSQIYPWGLVAHKNAWLAFLPVAWEQQLQPGDRILRANGETEVNAIARVLLCSEVIQVHLLFQRGLAATTCTPSTLRTVGWQAALAAQARADGRRAWTLQATAQAGKHARAAWDAASWDAASARWDAAPDVPYRGVGRYPLGHVLGSLSFFDRWAATMALR